MKPAEVLAHNRALVTRIQTEGALAAYEAALEVCLDKKAPAPARATASGLILRAAGFLNAPDEASHKEPHQMTATELEARIAELRGGKTDKTGGRGSDDSVFG